MSGRSQDAVRDPVQEDLHPPMEDDPLAHRLGDIPHAEFESVQPLIGVQRVEAVEYLVDGGSSEHLFRKRIGQGIVDAGGQGFRTALLVQADATVAQSERQDRGHQFGPAHRPPRLEAGQPFRAMA
jgi:hypothetical protein